MSAGNALMRKFFGISSNAYLELQWISYSSVFLLGSAYLLKKDGHIRIDILYSHFSNHTKNIINLLGYSLLFLPFFILIFYHTIPFWLDSFIPTNAIESWSYYLIEDTEYYEMSANAGGLPTPWAKLLLPMGVFFLIIQTISEIIKLSCKLFRENNG